MEKEKQKYLLSDIVIDGIELQAEYKELMEKEKLGEITTEEIGTILKCPYTMIQEDKI